MTSRAGLDLNRGRPLPAIGTTEAKLQQRKLDALNRGIHRIADATALPFGIHLVGVGKEGSRVVESFLRETPKDLLDVPGSRFTGLVVDIGDENLSKVRSAVGKFPAKKSQVETVALDLPEMEDLQDTLKRYPEFLKLEYPLYHENLDSTAWLPPETLLRDNDGTIPRAVAKAVYGRAYYDGDRPMLAALRRFASSVEETGGDSIVCIVFGLGDSSGSGIAMDLARHVSSRMFGRRMLVTGIGIAPHPEEMTPSSSSQLHTVLSELDVLCDETKNKKIEVSCGDLYKNPFTAGFVVVPQIKKMSAEQSCEEVYRRLSMLFTERQGANLWEALRLLNWVAAPSTQHSAARTPWGERWIHMFGFGANEDIPQLNNMREDLGLLPDYQPEFLELRVSEETGENIAGAWADTLEAAFAPEAPVSHAVGSSENTVQYLLPRMAISDLSISYQAQTAYDAETEDRRRTHHALLLDQGLVLNEPSKEFEGMAGANFGESRQWISIPLHTLRRETI